MAGGSGGAWGCSTFIKIKYKYYIHRFFILALKLYFSLAHALDDLSGLEKVETWLLAGLGNHVHEVFGIRDVVEPAKVHARMHSAFGGKSKLEELPHRENVAIGFYLVLGL